MAATAPRLRVQLIVLAVALVIGLAGAVMWSRTVADGEDGATDAVLDAPGEYAQPAAAANPPLPADRLPDVELLDIDGSAVELTGDGRPMVVNLWYSTCPPCARELADFATVEAELGDDVRFVGVNPYDTVAAMVRFAAERGVEYELLRDPELELVDALGVAAFPVTLFVAADGTILMSTGSIDAAELRQHIEAHFG